MVSGGRRKGEYSYTMEEEIQEQPETAKVDVKAEQYNKPKDVRLPLPGSLQEIVGSLLFASQSPLSVADLRECVRGVDPENGDDAEVTRIVSACMESEFNAKVEKATKAVIESISTDGRPTGYIDNWKEPGHG